LKKGKAVGTEERENRRQGGKRDEVLEEAKWLQGEKEN
jgi:hypothetical protein